MEPPQNGSTGQATVNENMVDIVNYCIDNMDQQKDQFNRSDLINQIMRLDSDRTQAETELQILNRKLFDYFNGKKDFNAISTNSEEIKMDSLKYLDKYNLMLDEMSTAINSEENTKNCYEKELNKMNREKADINEMVTNQVDELSNTISSFALGLNNSTTHQYLSEKTVNIILRRMQNMRTIRSKERLALIKIEEKLAEVKGKALDLEDIGNGLKMIDLERLRTETRNLTDKIQERNSEILKLRKRCFGETQILAHIREKNHILRNEINNQSDILDELREEMLVERRLLSEINIKRDQDRKTILKLTKYSGLLGQPLLLSDYDRTAESVKDCLDQIQLLEEDFDANQK